MHTARRRKTHFKTLLAKQFFILKKEVDEFLKRK